MVRLALILRFVFLGYFLNAQGGHLIFSTLVDWKFNVFQPPLNAGIFIQFRTFSTCISPAFVLGSTSESLNLACADFWPNSRRLLCNYLDCLLCSPGYTVLQIPAKLIPLNSNPFLLGFVTPMCNLWPTPPFAVWSKVPLGRKPWWSWGFSISQG